MFTHTWEAMGTQWYVAVFAEPNQESEILQLWQQIERQTQIFEKRFSRFIPTSEVNAFRDISEPTGATVSPELGELLRFAQIWNKKTQGKFDPAVGGLLEAAGYDAQYSFRPRQPEQWQQPMWSISKTNKLLVSAPMIIDIGGFGKGFWIDAVSHLLVKNGFPYHLVDGGGDMFATQKPDGEGWRVALQNPNDSEKALYVLTLKYQGLAVSDTLKRRWGEWHHVVNPNTKLPANHLVYAAITAPTALVADVLTTCLMVCSEDDWPQLLENTHAGYFTLTQTGSFLVSDHWRGELLDK